VTEQEKQRRSVLELSAVTISWRSVGGRCQESTATDISRQRVWNCLWLELLVIWRVRTPIGDANAKPVLCVVVSSGPIWVADAECNGASIDAVYGRERVCSLGGAS
jgi:hypothetical protein